MKTISFTLDLKSFLLGACTLGVWLLLSNHRPAARPPAAPDATNYRRYQAFVSDSYFIILDTQTGRFIEKQSSLSKERWANYDFEAIMTKGQK